MGVIEEVVEVEVEVQISAGNRRSSVRCMCACQKEGHVKR